MKLKLKHKIVALSVAFALALSFGSVSAQEPTTFFGAWPYRVPPDGHFNTFAVGAMHLGIYRVLMEPPLATYIWAEGRYEPMLAESFGFGEDGNFTVTLRAGVSWSDGTPVSSADVVATFNTGYLLNRTIWESMKRVEAVDERTVVFHLTEASHAIERLILTERIAPASVYGEFGEGARVLIEAGVRSGDERFDGLLNKLIEFRPTTFVSAGPYVLEPHNIADARVLLVRNPGGLNAEVVRFDQVVLWNGETEAVTPLVAGGQLWYATHGFPPVTEASFIQLGLDILRAPSYSGPALYFNHSVSPFYRPEVRRALAFAIDRDENGFVSLSKSGVAVEYMIGFSDRLAPAWLSDEMLANLETYDHDIERAAMLLEEAGFSRGADGIWIDDTGRRMAFTLTFPAEFLDWAAAAENLSAQLNAFGFQITTRGVHFVQQLQDVYDSNFELAIRQWGAASPFPFESYVVPYLTFNGLGEWAGEAVGGGMRFNVNVTYSGGEMNVIEATIASGRGMDHDVQAQYIVRLAQSFNELLPIIPLWERYGNNPLNRNRLDAPPADDIIFINPHGGLDAFVPFLILTGRIGPADQ